MAVSYTHLDVYKRQVLSIAIGIGEAGWDDGGVVGCCRCARCDVGRFGWLLMGLMINDNARVTISSVNEKS